MKKRIYLIFFLIILLIASGCNVYLHHKSSSFLLHNINKEPIRFYERNILLSKPKDNVVKFIYDLGKPTIFIITYIRKEYKKEKGVMVLVNRETFIRFRNWINHTKRKKKNQGNQDELMRKFLDPYQKNPAHPNQQNPETS